MKAEGSFEEVVMLMQLHLEQLEDNNKNKRRGGGGIAVMELPIQLR